MNQGESSSNLIERPILQDFGTKQPQPHQFELSLPRRSLAEIAA
jgi:hypothetical protein